MERLRRSLLLLHALSVLPRHGQSTPATEDLSYLNYDMAAQGSRTCLNNSIAYANRANISFGDFSTPVKIWQFSWPCAHTLAEVVKIFIQEKLGFHAITFGNIGASNTAYTALMDCYNPGDVSRPCRVQVPGSRGHLAYEVWSNYDGSMLAKAVAEDTMDRFPIRVGYPGGIGYDGVEGMFVGSSSYDASGAVMPPLPLRWYESYNDSWADPRPYFTDYADLPNPSQACHTIGALTMAGGLADYIAATSDSIPTEMVSGVEVAQCFDGWVPSLACRARNRVGCIPVITTGGYSLPAMMQWSYWHNIATMLGSFAWGDYTNVVRTNRTLCYWWVPDDTFSGQGLTPIQFPPRDSDEQAMGIIRTAKAATKIWKMMSNLVPAAEPLIETFMERFEISMGSMMSICETYNAADPWQTACNFLQTYPERWSVWEPDRTACILGQGLTTDANGEQMCAWCPFGTYSAPHPTLSTSRVCASCPAGEYQSSPGQTECLTCMAGAHAAAAGMSACEQCPLGTYTNATGMSSCSSCGEGKAEPTFWTTMQVLPTATGTRISYVNGATDQSACTCDVDRRFQGPECVACSEELQCAGMGNVQVLPGFAALNADVNQIFECYLDTRWCPGGDAGVCAEGRQGPLCGECKPNYTPSEGGKCEKCEGNDTLPFIIVLACVFVILCLGYHNVARAQVGKGKAPLSVMLMVTTGGQIIAFTQMTGTFSSMDTDWGEPFATVMAFAKIITSFNLDYIKLSCVTQLSPLATYISRVSIIFIGVATILVIFVIHTTVIMKGDFKRMGKKLVVCLGALSMSLYISVVATVTAPLQCVEHPCGEWTVRSYPVVLCGEIGLDGDYGKMVIIACGAALFPLGLLAIVAWCNFQFASRMKNVDTGFFEVAGFLFVCYRVETYWYCLATWVRNLIVALVPILPNVVAQITVFNMLLLFMLVLASHNFPWRARPANFLDIALYAGIICINGFAIGFATPDTTLMAWIAMIFIMVALFAIFLAGLFGLAKMIMGVKKQYEYFVSHHKAVTGAFARLLKMMIIEARSDSTVFLDSDNLVNLDVLFDTVANDVEHIVMVTNKEFMKRPWCMGELAIAQIKKVKVWPLYHTDFTPPDDDFITNYTSHVPDMTTLTEQNITLESVQAGMRWFRDLPHIDLPERMGSIELNKLLKNILSKNMQSLADTVCENKSQIARADAKIMIACDHTIFQAAMAARVLCKLLGGYAKQEADTLNMSKNLPEMLADACGDDKPQLSKSTSLLMVVLSNGCLTNPDMISILHQATQTKPVLMPVVADDGFRFPSVELYDQLYSEYSACLPPSDAETVVSGVFMMFKRIAPLFEPNASTLLLSAQSGEVYKKIKLLVDASSEGDWDAWKSGGAKSVSIEPGKTEKTEKTEEPEGKPSGPDVNSICLV